MYTIFTGRKTAVNTLGTAYDYMALALDCKQEWSQKQRQKQERSKLPETSVSTLLNSAEMYRPKLISELQTRTLIWNKNMIFSSKI